MTMGPWIHRHTIIHMEAPTDLGTALPAKFWHVLASQPPLGASQYHWMQRRCIQGPVGAPMPPLDAPLPPPTSLLPTSTPYASLHYK